ncbi:RusA family crossover junction endodeoxyribonuclease [Achromobacter xylosoxidans]|uniref:RusA family crossover junction endodeoxyribonuclease n=1 Tax=Alcaligenes xylosoxydans xylosoxydans TaxID=85698 RepID=UPI001F0EDEAD|nr:RusA family crossover junction endodeoxyribonuclease [Achromobacter xylosoxidans]MCH4574978.1 RusA family crossover junction endodeoxyribonuclease [Achromobacter xylosoxidans]
MNASPNLTDPYDPMAGTLARTAMQCQARGCDGCLICRPAGAAQVVQERHKTAGGAGAAPDTFARAQGEIANLRNSSSSVPDAARAVLLTLPYPISANRYWASRTVTPRGKPAFTSTYVTPEAKAYKAQVQKLALVAGVRKPIAGRVRVEFTLYPNRPLDWQKRMRKDGAAWDDTVQCLDLDNAQKVVLDSLKDVVFQDDAWVREISARRAEPDEFGARLVAVVTPLAVEQPQTDLFGAVAQERKA